MNLTLDESDTPYEIPAPNPTTLTDGQAGYGVPSEAAIKCTRCNNAGYIWLTETPDTGHDYQANCPVCNPKIDLYAADRYDPDF